MGSKPTNKATHMTQDTNPNEAARRRDLLDAIGKAAELHHHMLLVLIVLIAGQCVVAAVKGDANALIFAAMAVTLITLGIRLWVYHDLLASIRMRLRPLLEGENAAPSAKTRQELDWLTQQDPLLERISVWGLWLGAALTAGGCLV